MRHKRPASVQKVAKALLESAKRAGKTHESVVVFRVQQDWTARWYLSSNTKVGYLMTRYEDWYWCDGKDGKDHLLTGVRDAIEMAQYWFQTS